MKSYKQTCGIARALDLVGDRWTLLILRDLLVGSLRYGELLAGLEGITTNLLADRLKHLTGAGLVTREGSGGHTVYMLSDEGRTIEPVLLALGRWGWTYVDLADKSNRRSLRWAMVSLKRRLHPSGSDYQIAFSTPDSTYVVWEKHAVVRIESSAAPAADLVITGPEKALLRLVVEGEARPWNDKAVTLAGDRVAWASFLRGLRQ